MSLDSLASIYFPSEVDIDKELFAPVARVSTSLDCMVGYFTSGLLAELSTAISTYLNSNQSTPMRFIISPFLTEKDLNAIKNAHELNQDFFHILFPNFLIDEDSLRTKTITVLSYLISLGKLEIKIALMDAGLFHTKAWLFNTPNGKLAIHGSSNATTGGLSKNFEQLSLDRSWKNDDAEYKVIQLEQRFDKLWSANYDNVDVLPLNQETLVHIQKLAPIGKANLEKKMRDAQESNLDDEDLLLFEKPTLKIPSFINYETGEFSHQGDAVNAWLNNNNHGILSIATGGGKTYTSLIAATKVLEKYGSLFLLVAVPTKALMNQWEDDIKEFSINPLNTNGLNSNTIKRELRSALRNIRHGASDVEIAIITHDALSSELLESIRPLLSDVNSMLVVDEVHNIGTKRAQENFPIEFKYKLGLSATYERQFDEEGTQFLLDTFQGVVYEYGLDKAIGSCLVNYEYYAHFVNLNATEEDEFVDLTERIRRLAFASEYPDGSNEKEMWKTLCIRRRAIIESAANKIATLAELLPTDSSDIQRTLIFCTDKNPDQLIEVNRLLIDKGVKFHQITAEETSNNKKLKNIVDMFSNNMLQVLTSKRVLDEGFNVPQTEVAYLLASNTVVRQWVQRLGRVLRLSPKTGKEKAVIHDFLVLPMTDEMDADFKALLNSEYERVHFFSQYSTNYMDENGGYRATERILELLGV